MNFNSCVGGLPSGKRPSFCSHGRSSLSSVNRIMTIFCLQIVNCLLFVLGLVPYENQIIFRRTSTASFAKSYNPCGGKSCSTQWYLYLPLKMWDFMCILDARGLIRLCSSGLPVLLLPQKELSLKMKLGLYQYHNPTQPCLFSHSQSQEFSVGIILLTLLQTL